ncbi:GNAT family N-acetyltransferase [Cellulomonas hominis]|uniref:GNAT family N-acetyltransferase n=1 Tax=Cellulomonas hominis TaxID=156981 RepID=UPI001C11B9C0|nr:GNAT family N-acetyltransferase [Cellulomonas hominis]MBU5421243.1 GNAT family N-acetyltransferase [Cellulomonas hominis]
MTTITPLARADHDDWRTLWGGYLAFYETTVDEHITAGTFERLVTPGGDLRGAIARDADGTAVGFVHWLTHPATWTDTSYCYLEDLFVSDAARGAGVGRGLIAHVRERAEQAGATKVYWLTAETNTAARALYDRVGTLSGMVHYEIRLGDAERDPGSGA